MRRHEQGATVVELMVSLAIGGLVLALVVSCFDAVGVTVGALRAGMLGDDRTAAATRWLSAALQSTRPPTESEPFIGTPDSLTFSARTRRADGACQSERIVLHRRGKVVKAERSVEGAVVLADTNEWTRLGYFAAGGARPSWVDTWRSATTAPLAVRLCRRRADGGADTVIMLIRDRR